MNSEDDVSLLRAKLATLQTEHQQLLDEYANLYDAHGEMHRTQERLIATLLNYLECETDREKEALKVFLKAAMVV